MFVLGHVENTQTINYFILFFNSPALLLQLIINILFLYKNKSQNKLYTIYTIRYSLPGLELEIWLEELAIHGCIQQITL